MSKNNWDNIGVVILAAGRGARMKSLLPKPLHMFRGKPLVVHTVDTVRQSDIPTQPVVVVSQDTSVIAETCGDVALYALQKEQLGTADAVKSAKQEVRRFEHILVLACDMPLLSAETLNRLVAEHLLLENTITFVTTTIAGITNDNNAFAHFGRVVRAHDGGVQKIVEAKDATDVELQIGEVNISVYCFRSQWLWERIERVEPKNAQGEYYITDLIEMGIEEGEAISSVSAEAKEAAHISTQEDLQQLHRVSYE